MGKYHPVAKVFRDGTRGVSKEHVARAAKLLHALATESTARGREVTLPSSHKRTNSRGTTTLNGDIAITIGTPPPEKQGEIADAIDAVDRQIAATRAEIVTAQTGRAALLDALLSRKVVVALPVDDENGDSVAEADA
ncbi:MAG: hypothetical protein JWQ59_2406 [Cryobacterium sp.]|nr:hypothetical protein [Cryobacterium sp.]